MFDQLDVVMALAHLIHADDQIGWELLSRVTDIPDFALKEDFKYIQEKMKISPLEYVFSCCWRARRKD